MAPERDLFANFERMRRQMDELFGDVFDRAGVTTRRRHGFTPAVDVYYMDDPPRAVVKAELAGIDPESIGLEIQGRELVLAGHRHSATDDASRVYQQLEIEHGSFRRVIELGVDVVPDEARAIYEDGMLRVELPLQRSDSRARSVPIEVSGERSTEVEPR